jgi:hypothetical protein
MYIYIYICIYINIYVYIYMYKYIHIDININLQASSEKVLPLIGTAIELAPGLLPFAAIALQTKPTVFFGTYT